MAVLQRIQAQAEAKSSGESEQLAQYEALLSENTLLTEQLKQTKEQVPPSVGVALV